MRAVLEQRAESEPDRIVLSVDGEPETARGLLRRVVSAANQLIALGLQPGDRVGLYGANSTEWIVTFLACACAGLRAVPINVAFRGDFLVRQLTQSGVKLLFVDRDQLDAMSAVAAALPALSTVVIRDLRESVELGDGVRVLSSTYLAEGPRDELFGAPDLEGDEPFCIFYTSGTTGPSKGAVVTQQYLLAGATTIAHQLRVLHAGLPLRSHAVVPLRGERWGCCCPDWSAVPPSRWTAYSASAHSGPASNASGRPSSWASGRWSTWCSVRVGRRPVGSTCRCVSSSAHPLPRTSGRGSNATTRASSVVSMA